MKKLLSLMLVLILSLSLLAGCGGEGETDTTAPQGGTTSPQGDDTTAPASAVIESADDLANKKIAVQEGTTGDIYVTDEVEGAEIVRFKKVTDTALELMNGRVDAIVLDIYPARRLVEANPDKLMILEGELTNEQYAMAVNKDNEEFLAEVNAAINDLRDEGIYDILYDIFILGQDHEMPALPEYTPDGKLTMGTNAEFEPFEYRDDNNEITGFDIWMMKHIAQRLGKELVIEDMPFDALIAALNTGKIEIIAAGMTADEERRKNVDFTQNYFDSTQVIIVPKA